MPISLKFCAIRSRSSSDADIIRAPATEFCARPRYAGEIRCRVDQEEGVLALLTTYVQNQGNVGRMLDIARFRARPLDRSTRVDEETQLTELAGGVFRPFAATRGADAPSMSGINRRKDFALGPYASTALTYQTMRSLPRTERGVTNKLPDLGPEIRARSTRLVLAHATFLMHTRFC
jgi:hypothetical protein